MNEKSDTEEAPEKAELFEGRLFLQGDRLRVCAKDVHITVEQTHLIDRGDVGEKKEEVIRFFRDERRREATPCDHKECERAFTKKVELPDTIWNDLPENKE